MPDDFDLTPDDELDDESTEEVEDFEDSEEQSGEEVDKLALLEQRLAAVEGQNTKIVRDFSSAVGRVQSLIDKIDSGRQTDTAKLQQQLTTALGGVESQLDTILSSDVIDPEIRARAQQARDRMRAESELAAMKSEIAALKTPPPAPQQYVDPNALSPIEAVVHTMIGSAGMKIEDFDWNEANAVLGANGEAGVIAYFTNKIADRKSEATAAERRQTKKTNAGRGAPSGAAPGGDVASKLEQDLASGNLDDAVARLRELGVNPY